MRMRIDGRLLLHSLCQMSKNSLSLSSYQPNNTPRANLVAQTSTSLWKMRAGMVIVLYSTARWTNSYSHFSISNNLFTVLSLNNTVTGKVLFGGNYPYLNSWPCICGYKYSTPAPGQRMLARKFETLCEGRCRARPSCQGWGGSLRGGLKKENACRKFLPGRCKAQQMSATAGRAGDRVRGGYTDHAVRFPGVLCWRRNPEVERGSRVACPTYASQERAK